MRRLFPIVVVIFLFVLVGILAWVWNDLDVRGRPTPAKMVKSQVLPPSPNVPPAGEFLLAGYGDPATPPIEDLRKIHRVATGYFSVVKDSSRFPIGGNEDFSAALRGENPNHEVLVRAGHPVFSPAGLLIDRWGSPLIVHPQAWRQLELRSARPDRVPYNADDLIVAPTGVSVQAR